MPLTANPLSVVALMLSGVYGPLAGAVTAESFRILRLPPIPTYGPSAAWALVPKETSITASAASTPFVAFEKRRMPGGKAGSWETTINEVSMRIDFSSSPKICGTGSFIDVIGSFAQHTYLPCYNQ